MSQKLCMMTPLIFRVDLFNELVEHFGKRLKWSDLQAFVFVFQMRKAWAYLPMELLVIPSLPKPLIVRNRSNYSSVHEITCSSRLGICLGSPSQPAEHVCPQADIHTQDICTHLRVPCQVHTIRRHHGAHQDTGWK